MSEFGGHITLTNNWARAILQSMYWVKRNRTVRKIVEFPRISTSRTPKTIGEIN